MGKPKTTVDNMDERTRMTIVERHRDGATQAQIAEELGICERTVMRYMRVLGIRTLPLPTSDEALLKMHADGLSLSKISGETGVSAVTLKKRLRSLGVEFQRSKSPWRYGDKGSHAQLWAPTKYEQRADGLFKPEYVGGDGPLSRRYRQQLAERGYCKEG